MDEKQIKVLQTTLVFYGAIIDSLLDMLYINNIIDKDEYSVNLKNRIEKIKEKKSINKKADPSEISELYWGEGGDA